MLVSSLLVSTEANAHIKWFEPYDIRQALQPPGDVLSQSFVLLFVASAILIFVFFLVDRHAFRKGILSRFDQKLKMFNALGVGIMRAAGAVFFFSVFVYGFVFGAPFYLTPELATSARWVPWVQLLTALAATHRRTTPFMLVGILVLFAGGLADYGLFHMLDYILFLSAIFIFGLIDAIGHLMIIAVLLVLMIRGPTDARSILVLNDKALVMEAYFMTGLYYFALVNAFLLYYGLHYLFV